MFRTLAMPLQVTCSEADGTVATTLTALTEIPQELRDAEIDMDAPERKEFYLSLINFMRQRG
jgi:hypothetical protein